MAGSGEGVEQGRGNPPMADIRAADEIDLVEVARTLWRGRWWIAASVGLFLVLASIWLRVATYRYTASLTLMPAQASGSALGRLSGLGGMAAMAGLSLPQDSGSINMTLFTEGVHSRELADRMIHRRDLMHVIFAPEWNPEKQQWQDPSLGGVSPGRVAKAVLGAPVYRWVPPDGARLQEFLMRHLKVSPDKETGFVTLSFDDADPAFAARLVDAVAADMNGIIQRQALQRSTENIAYLTRQLKDTTVLEQRLAIVQALTEQEQKRMMANASAPYAADPIGTASASLRPTSPKPILVVAAAFFGGLMAGFLFVLGRERFRVRDDDLPED